MEIRLKHFKNALDGFEYLVNLDFEDLKTRVNEKIIDGIKNGQAQKFEMCTELEWKIVKRFLYENDGIESRSPKQAIKDFYLAGYIEEEDYLLLNDMINDRNKLSHIYNEKEFNKIVDRFPQYLKLMKKVYQIVSSSVNTNMAG
jgi:nucleotidyltransferase substrate binding protein (TIGR01987 family)